MLLSKVEFLVLEMLKILRILSLAESNFDEIITMKRKKRRGIYIYIYIYNSVRPASPGLLQCSLCSTPPPPPSPSRCAYLQYSSKTLPTFHSTILASCASLQNPSALHRTSSCKVAPILSAARTYNTHVAKCLRRSMSEFEVYQQLQKFRLVGVPDLF